MGEGFLFFLLFFFLAKRSKYLFHFFVFFCGRKCGTGSGVGFLFHCFPEKPLFGLDKQCRTGTIKDVAELTASVNPTRVYFNPAEAPENPPHTPTPCVIESRMGSWVWAELRGDEAE